jgi:hypothetical protein
MAEPNTGTAAKAWTELPEAGGTTSIAAGNAAHARRVEWNREAAIVPASALVAQLDRASDFESEGREFESLRARHKIKYLAGGDRSLNVGAPALLPHLNQY